MRYIELFVGFIISTLVLMGLMWVFVEVTLPKMGY